MALLSKGSSRKHNQDAETRGIGQKNFIPPGIHMARFSGIEAKQTSSNHPSLVETIEVKGYDPLQNWLVFQNEDAVAWSILAKQLQVAGTNGLPDEVETIEGLAKHVSSVLLGKPFKINVYNEKRIYKKSAVQWYLNLEPRLAFIAKPDEEVSFDPTRSVKELSPEQQIEWEQYMAKKGGKQIQPPKTTEPAQASSGTDDLDDLDETPQPPQKPAKKAPPAEEAPATNTSTAHADLDELD